MTTFAAGAGMLLLGATVLVAAPVLLPAIGVAAGVVSGVAIAGAAAAVVGAGVAGYSAGQILIGNLPTVKFETKTKTETKTIAQTTTKEKPKPPSANFYDVMLMGQGSGIVVFAAEPFNAEVAKAKVLKGLDVWTPLKSDAMALAVYASGGYVGPEGGNGDCYHFHLSKRLKGSHIFYGTYGIFDMVDAS